MVAARTWESQRVRHTRHNPCPICTGYDEAPRGQGVRCGGFTVGTLVYCQREQYAGRAPFNPGAAAYRHRLAGLCACGVMHTPGGAAAYGAIPHTPTPIRPRGPGKPKGPPGELVDLYTYTRADGSPSFQVCRYRKPDGGKDFRQRRPDGQGGWIWSMAGADLVLYRLPELLAAPADQPVFIVEGEKDVERMAELGLVATCNPMGAGKWRAEYNSWLAGRVVVILADNDPVGTDHAAAVALSLTGVAAYLRVITLPGLPERGDVSDWLDAGNAPADLLAWAAVWPLWQPPAPAPHSSGDEPERVNASHLAPEESQARPCRCGKGCCDWRQQIVAAARNRGSRDLLATFIGMDDLFRRREAAGYGVETAFRISTAYKAKETGCSPGTYLSTAKELSAKGVLAYSQRHVRAGDKRPDGTRYERPETHSFLAVPGGPDAALAAFARLTPEPERRGGKRTPLTLPACTSCGSVHVTPICEECGEVQDVAGKGTAPAEEYGFIDLVPDADDAPGSAGEGTDGDPGSVSENQSLLALIRSEGEIGGALKNAAPKENPLCPEPNRYPTPPSRNAPPPATPAPPAATAAAGDW